MFTRFPAPIRWWERVYTRKRYHSFESTNQIPSQPLLLSYTNRPIFLLTLLEVVRGKISHLSPPGGKNWQLLLTSVNKWLWRKCFPNRDTKSLRPSCSCKPVLHVNHRQTRPSPLETGFLTAVLRPLHKVSFQWPDCRTRPFIPTLSHGVKVFLQ